MLVVLVVAGVGLAVGLGLKAFRRNLLYYYSPTQIAEGKAPSNQEFNLGGLVAKGSFHRDQGSLTVHFKVTDTLKTIPVEYTGILPDLFREGQGIVAYGQLNDDGIFVADRVLAKHDENYMPPTVKETLKEAHEKGVMRTSGTATGGSS
jgi:cytochrome c-type biogenesis protein CcmE